MADDGDTPLSYESAGVRYDIVDPAKVTAQRAALATAANLLGHGMSEVPDSRGESAYVVDVGPFYLATIVECLGTKALVADEMHRLTGRHYYDLIAQDTIAMAVNDLITVGATPLTVQAYWAAGDSEWFADEIRVRQLVQGWQQACNRCGVAWGGGETPALGGVVAPGRVDLAASCTGIIAPKDRLSLGSSLGAGQAIVLLGATGIHANGVSLARRLAQRHPKGYLAPMADGQSFGEALLRPTALYPPVTQRLHGQGIKIHYAINITGHGWRKLLRHSSSWTYRIERLPPVPPVLDFIRQQAKLDDAAAYGTLNMGAGFALIVDAERADETVKLAVDCGIPALWAGHVERGPRQLVVEPLGLRFDGDTLRLRPAS